VKRETDQTGIEYRSDSTMATVDLVTGQAALRNIQVKYQAFKEGSVTYLVYSIYNHAGTLLEKKRFNYRLKGDTLYMPRIKEKNGVESIKDYADIFIRYKK
jgi:hypothetical protein